MKTISGIVVLFFCITLTALPAPGQDGPPRIGDPLPAMNVDTWIQGDPLAWDSIRSGQVVVLEFWGTWCPVCRTVLARQDSLERALDGRAVFVAVTREDPAAVRAFLAVAGWKHLRIGGDPTGALTRTFLRIPPGNEGKDPRLLPYAFITRHQGGGERDTILWMGSVADPGAEEPLAAFESSLDEILANRYDLAGATEIARQEARSLDLFDESAVALKEDDLDTIESFLNEIVGVKLAPSLENTLVSNMNGLAWQLVTRENRSARHVELAERACRIAMDAGGETDAAFLDTYARVLFEKGKIQEAHDMEERAVELAKGSSLYAELQKTLDSYGRKLGLPPLGEPAEAPEAKSEEAPKPWSGNLNSVWDTFDKSQIVLVRSTPAADAGEESAWTREMQSLQSSFFKESRLCVAKEVTAEERQKKVLLLYGTSAANDLTRHILDHHHIEVAADGVRVGEQLLPAKNPVLITCVPNPWTPSLPVVVYTAYSAKDALGLNRFFHGPTAFVLGRWTEGKPDVLNSLDYLPGSGPGNDAGLALAVGPATLGAEEAVEDLDDLQNLLEQHYAGYADLEWKLHMQGSSWPKHTAEFERRIRDQRSMTWSGFFDLLREYLDPVEDTHFEMSGSGSGDGAILTRRAAFVHSLVPYFSDLRIEEKGGAFAVTAAPDTLAGLVGSEIVDVAVVGTPHSVRPGVPFLFPTLPSKGRRDGEPPREYLLGVFGEGETLPATVAARARRSDENQPREIQLPVHRGRSALGRRGGSNWNLASPPEVPITVLSVRTMAQKPLQGLDETADSLRTLPHLVLDLRKNGGGADTPAMQWCQRFSGQPYEWIAQVAHWSGRTDPLRAWFCFPGSTRPLIAGPSFPSAPEPFPGRLFVLVDKGVASSGETFTHLAGQVRGAVLIGENTAGCVNYGNVEQHGPLPHSRIEFRFGRSRFVVDWVRANREGVGFFPDYWLDVADPVAAIATYCQGALD